jgi:hypothetical protein
MMDGITRRIAPRGLAGLAAMASALLLVPAELAQAWT